MWGFMRVHKKGIRATSVEIIIITFIGKADVADCILLFMHKIPVSSLV